jgi:hypothetical protein
MDFTRCPAAALVLAGDATTLLPLLLLPLTTLSTELIMELAAPPLLGSLEGGADPHTPLPRLPLLLLLLLLVLQPNPWGLRQLALLVPVLPMLLPLLLLVRRTEEASPVLLVLAGLLGLLLFLLLMPSSVKLLRPLLLLSLYRCIAGACTPAAAWAADWARSC